MKKLVLFCMICLATLSMQAQKRVPDGYTDLGLPSGTLWKNYNATGLYTFDEAISQFGNRLPSKEQWKELKAECQWKKTRKGFIVTGPNGQSITLPAEGERNCNGSKHSGGYYWSSTLCEGFPCAFCFGRLDVTTYGPCNAYSVRLVQK